MEGYTDNDLKHEAEHLFGCLFNEAAPPELATLYLRAHESLTELGDFPTRELQTVSRIVNRRLNAAMIEPWLRRKNGRRHAVSAKLLLLVYLAECGYAPPGALRCGPQSRFGIVSAALRGFVGLTCGYYFKVRYGLF